MRFLLYFALVASILANFGVDISMETSFETFQCFKDQGMSYAIIRGYSPNGTLDSNAIYSLNNAKSAGLYTDIYMSPCRGSIAATQVNDMINRIPSTLYGMVWLQVVQNQQAGCSWAGHTTTSNCQYVYELANAVKTRGKNFGIYSSNDQWNLFMNTTSFLCLLIETQQIWYYNLDNNPSFQDWDVIKFGQWTTPNMKQYQQNASICGVNVNRNFS